MSDSLAITGPIYITIALRRHQYQGLRAGLINKEFDNVFFDRVIADPKGQASVPHINHVREAGSERIEMVMWLIVCGAIADVDPVPLGSVAPDATKNIAVNVRRVNVKPRFQSM